MGNQPWKNLNAIDRITLLYLAITTLFIGLSWNDLESILIPLAFRICCVVFICLIARYYNGTHGRILHYLRYAYPLILIIYLYPETDLFNNFIFEDQDPFFFRIEAMIFGSQPSTQFLNQFPQLWVTELMSIGYFSYYLLIFSFSLILYLKDHDLFYRITFIMVCSFYIYYIIFIFLPVAGPQYYLSPPEDEVPKAYLFSGLLKLIQELGERPTGAFPSSHVGVALIILWYSYKHFKGYFITILPISVLLIFSTVYLKAHYVVDVLAAILSIPLFIIAGKYLFERIKKEHSDLRTSPEKQQILLENISKNQGKG